MSDASAATRTVAVVEDDAFVRTATGSLVRALGWVAATYDSAASFLRSETVESIDCLLCDIRMEGMDGIELLEHLQREGWRRPTIFVTALAADHLRDHVLGLGALCLIEKPVDISELEQALTRAWAPR